MSSRDGLSGREWAFNQWMKELGTVGYSNGFMEIKIDNFKNPAHRSRMRCNKDVCSTCYLNGWSFTHCAVPSHPKEDPPRFI